MKQQIFAFMALPILFAIAAPTLAADCPTGGSMIVGSLVTSNAVTGDVVYESAGNTPFRLLIPANVLPKFSGGVTTIETGYSLKFSIQLDPLRTGVGLGDTLTGCIAEAVEVRPPSKPSGKNGSGVRGGDRL